MQDSGIFVIYSRKSRITGVGESVENQVVLCRRYLELQYGSEAAAAARVYEDEGFSGGNLERPQFRTMMQDAETGNFRAIVVYRLDRISRNIGDFAKLIEDLSRRGIGFLSIREQFDTASPMGRAMMYIASVFSQLERETIAERIRDNMLELARTGRWLGGVTPTGFVSECMESVTVDGKRKRVCALRILPEQAAVVKQLFSTFLQTHSLTRTETYFLQHGYTTKTGKTFTRFTIRGILTNPVYMAADGEAYRFFREAGADLCAGETQFDGSHGVMAYNRTQQTPGKANRMREICDWIVTVGKHPGLISGEDWVRTQKILAQNRSKAYKKPRGHTALLSGLLRCGVCGGYMRPKMTGHLEQDGTPSFRYQCVKKEKSHGQCCAGSNAPGSRLDLAVLQVIQQLPEDRMLLRQRLRQSRKNLLGQPQQAELTQLQERQKACRQELQGLMKALPNAAGTAAETHILQAVQKLDTELKTLAAQRETCEAAQQNRLSESEVYTLTQRLGSFSAAVREMPVMQRRECAQGLLDRVVWQGNGAEVFLQSGDEPCAPVFLSIETVAK